MKKRGLRHYKKRIPRVKGHITAREKKARMARDVSNGICACLGLAVIAVAPGWEEAEERVRHAWDDLEDRPLGATR